MKIALIVGSLREKSYNQQLADNIVKLAPSDVKFDSVSIDVPLFSEDLEANPPQEVKQAARQVQSADLVLIISPEYNRSVPGGLKNLIDWLSRSSTDFALSEKPVAIGGVSTGGVATAVMQSHLRSILLQINARVLAQPTLMIQAGRDLLDSGTLTDQAQENVSAFLNKAIEFTKQSL